MRRLLERDAPLDAVDAALALVVLEVGLLQHLGHRADRLDAAGSDRDEHEQLREALRQQREVREEEHDLTRRRGEEAGQREDGREDEASDSQQLHRDPRDRRDVPVEHVEMQARLADAVGAGGDAGRRRCARDRGSRDGDEGRHLADAGREPFHLPAETALRVSTGGEASADRSRWAP